MFIGFALLTVSILLFLSLIGWILPRALLRAVYPAVEPTGRGIKRCIYKGRRCVLYRPFAAQERYMRKYAIFSEDGYKLLKCQLTPLVESINFDVVIFNRHDEVTGVLKISESVATEMTDAIRLPDDASYVNIVIRKVNGEVTDTSAPVLPKVSGGRIFFYTLLVFLFTLAEAFVVKASCAFAFGGVFREDFLFSSESTVTALGLAAVAAVVCLIIEGIVIRSKK